MKMHCRARFPRHCVLLCFAYACFGTVVTAATIPWDGSDSTAWATGANWVGDTAPTDDTATDIAEFNSTFSNQPNVGAARSVNGISVGTSLGQNLAISGTQLTLGASGLQSSTTTRTITISSALVVDASQEWNLANTSANGTLVSGAVSGAGSLTKSGAGLLVFSNQTVGHAGGTTINGGTVDWAWNPGSSTSFGGGDITVNGGTFRWTTSNNNSVNLTNNFVVGASGGTVEAVSSNNTGQRNLTGQFSGAGALVLRHTGGGNSAVMRLAGDNSGFGGTLEIASADSSNNGGGVYFASQNAVPGGASENIVMSGARPIIGGDGLGMTLSNPIQVTSSTSYGMRGRAVRWTYDGAIDAGNRDLVVGGSSVSTRSLLTYAPSSTSNHTGNTSIVSGGLQVPDMNALPTGNLAISGGIFLLDGSGTVAPSFNSGSNRLTNRAYGTGSGQWQVTGTGGFAARGSDVTIDNAVSGIFDNRSFNLGSAALDSGSTLWADAAVLITQDINLGTSARTITVAGGNQESATRWTVNSPVHEISGTISGTGILNLSGVDRSNPYNGTIRISGNNSGYAAGMRINSSTSGGAGGGGGVVAVFTDDNAFGSGSVFVGTGGSGAAGMLLFENTGAGTKVFTKAFEVSLGGDASSGDSGFGSFGGNVQYNGDVTISGSASATLKMPIHVQAGTLSFGGSAQIINNHSTAGTFTYNKSGAGDLDIRTVDLLGGTKTDYTFTLHEGGLIIDQASDLASSGFSINNTFNAGNSSGLYDRSLMIRDNDITVSSPASSSFANRFNLDVETGRTFTLDMGANDLIVREQGTANGLTYGMTKTGDGTWVYHNTDTSPSAFGHNNGYIKVEEGTFDVTGNMGRTALWLSGGTILSGTYSPFVGTTQNNRLHIDADGGKIGISPNATGNVTRTIAFNDVNGNNVWNLGGTGALTLASRDNYNLTLGMNVPAIATGESLTIERDGTGTGYVQITNGLTIGGGTLGGTGTLNASVNYTTANGYFNSAGTLNVNGNVLFANTLTHEITAGTLAVNGTTTINPDTTLRVGAGGTSGDLADDVVNNGTLVFNRSDAQTYSYAITGSGDVDKIGAGTTTLTGNNNIGGTLTVSAGGIDLDSGSHQAGAFAVSGGTFTQADGVSWTTDLFHVNGSSSTIQVADLAVSTDQDSTITFTLDAGGSGTIVLADSTPFGLYTALAPRTWADEWTINLDTILGLTASQFQTVTLFSASSYDLTNLDGALNFQAWQDSGGIPTPFLFTNVQHGDTIYVSAGGAVGEFTVSFSQNSLQLVFESARAIPEPGSLSLVLLALLGLRRYLRRAWRS